MGQAKSYIKRRVAKVYDFVVDENQSLTVYQNVFGAVVSVNQGQPSAPGVFDKPVEESGSLFHLGGREFVVRFKSQGFKPGPVFESRCERRQLRRLAMNCPQQFSELQNMSFHRPF